MMKLKNFMLFAPVFLIAYYSCGQGVEKKITNEQEKDISKNTVEVIQHDFGGWYCPDNLGGFPAVNISEWKNVKVIIGRMPSEEEARNGSALIYVDPKEYPTATSTFMQLPRLATFSSPYTKREEVIIIIQAFQLGTDTILGYRYLNGGNGSSLLNQVKLINENDLALNQTAKFVSFSTSINSNAKKVREVLSYPENLPKLIQTFDQNQKLPSNWREKSNVNYHYAASGEVLSAYANVLFGNYYVQNDYDSLNYTEKFLILGDEKSGKTELKIACGPFLTNYEEQKIILINWAEKVKELSEQTQ